jgi:RNA polymerase sigma-70 factor, ECF subfamily
VDQLTRLAHTARQGDRRAWEACIRLSYPDVWRLCAALVDEATAEDLAQESFLRATRGLPGFRGDSSARTWLLAITRRACMDELRTRHRERARYRRIAADPSEEPLAPDPSGEVILRELLWHLDPDQRAAFVLTQMLRCPYEQTAGICECAVGTIRSRVARARSNLMLAIEEAHPRGQPQRGQHRRSSSRPQ